MEAVTIDIIQQLQYGDISDPLFIEYNQRKGFFSMPTSHMHSHFELYYLFQGERVYFIKDRSYVVKAGDIVVIPSDIVHRTSDSESGIPDHERLVIYFSEHYFQQLNADYADLLKTPFTHHQHVITIPQQEKVHIETQLYTMLREIQERPHGFQLTIENTTSSLLLFLARQILANQNKTDNQQLLSMTETKMIEVAQYINANFREPLTLKQLSLLFYLSESYLSRTFKKTTGFGLTEYIGMTRVKEAQRLLRMTTKRITDISDEVGFGSFAQFQKVFKEHTTVSPRSYRNHVQKKASPT